MGIATATIEMRSPEETRERLHELVKATRHVILLHATPASSIDGRAMDLVRAGDDTTMYLATLLDASQATELAENPRVTLVLQGAAYGLFTGEATVSRDRALIDELWSDAWRQWTRGKMDPALAIVIIRPIEGSVWEGSDRQSYMFRIVDDEPVGRAPTVPA
jgi:general stress protein 26